MVVLIGKTYKKTNNMEEQVLIAEFIERKTEKIQEINKKKTS